MLSTHGNLIASSIVQRNFGSGSSIFLINGLQARGDKLLIVGGHDDWAVFEDAHALTYAAYKGSDI